MNFLLAKITVQKLTVDRGLAFTQDREDVMISAITLQTACKVQKKTVAQAQLWTF